MSGKLPYMQWYTRDWLTDPGVSALTSASRSVWFDMLNVMHSAARSSLRHTPAQFARVCRCSETEAATAIDELESTGTADIKRHEDGSVTVESRRMIRESEERKSASERQKRKRDREGHDPSRSCHAAVTPYIQSQSQSQSQKQEPPNPPPSGGRVRRSAKPRATATEPPIPAGIDTPAFRAEWAKWLIHRAEMGKPLTPSMADGALDKLSRMGESVAIRKLQTARSNGWQGFDFPDREGGSLAKPGPQATTGPLTTGALAALKAERMGGGA